jgi:hypothetical protein
LVFLQGQGGTLTGIVYVGVPFLEEFGVFAGAKLDVNGDHVRRSPLSRRIGVFAGAGRDVNGDCPTGKVGEGPRSSKVPDDPGFGGEYAGCQ